MAFVTLTLEVEDFSAAELRARYDKATKRQQMAEYKSLLNGMVGGHIRGVITTQIHTAKASQTITCDFDTIVAGTDTITIGATTLNVETSPATEDDIGTGTDDPSFAILLDAGINAHSVLKEIYTSTVSGAVVTVKARFPGLLANEVALAEVGTCFVLGAAALAGGLSDEADEFPYGTPIGQ